MDYCKVVYYSDIVEVTRYENQPRFHERTTRVSKRDIEDAPRGDDLVDCGKNVEGKESKPRIRTEADARRSVMAFRRIAKANFNGSGSPVFVTITYAENMGDVSQARRDWKTFTERARYKFGTQFRYVCVSEFQQRGAVHFHAIFWGLPPESVVSERLTRLVAGLWGLGYVDIVPIKDEQKTSTYLSKYIAKNFNDSRLRGFRSYMVSRNAIRPVVDRGAILSAYFYGEHTGLPNLSTGVVLHESEYDTQYLGRANYKIYKILKSICPL